MNTSSSIRHLFIVTYSKYDFQLAELFMHVCQSVVFVFVYFCIFALHRFCQQCRSMAHCPNAKRSLQFRHQSNQYENPHQTDLFVCMQKYATASIVVWAHCIFQNDNSFSFCVLFANRCANWCVRQHVRAFIGVYDCTCLCVCVHM